MTTALATNIKQLLEVCNETVAHAAKDIGISSTTLTSIINGSIAKPRNETIAKIAAHFSVTPDSLLKTQDLTLKSRKEALAKLDSLIDECLDILDRERCTPVELHGSIAKHVSSRDLDALRADLVGAFINARGNLSVLSSIYANA